MEQPGKIKVREFGPYLSEFISHDGPIDELMETLMEYKTLGYEGICYIGDHQYDEPRLYMHREETDREYNRRLKELEIIRKKQEKQKEARRKQFEKLQAEFGVEGIATKG